MKMAALPARDASTQRIMPLQVQAVSEAWQGKRACSGGSHLHQ